MLNIEENMRRISEILNALEKMVDDLYEVGNDDAQYYEEIIGETMDGIQLDQFNLNLNKWILILGNEAHGLTPEIEQLIHKKITINGTGNQESLNIAVASGIILNYLNFPFGLSLLVLAKKKYIN